MQGATEVDLEVQSSKQWKNFVANLSPLDARSLRIWRGGAVGTPTRRFHGDDRRAICTFCSTGEFASAHHLFTTCAGFQQLRRNYSEMHGLLLCWWPNAQRITSKSGFITLSDAVTFDGRVQAQIAACRLGIDIVNQTGHLCGQWS